MCVGRAAGCGQPVGHSDNLLGTDVFSFGSSNRLSDKMRSAYYACLMSSSQPLITPDWFGPSALGAVLAAVAAAAGRLWRQAHRPTCGDGQQAAGSSAGLWHAVSCSAGRGPRKGGELAPTLAGRGRRARPTAFTAVRHGPFSFGASHHCRVRRPAVQAADAGAGPSGRRT